VAALIDIIVQNRRMDAVEVSLFVTVNRHRDLWKNDHQTRSNLGYLLARLSPSLIRSSDEQAIGAVLEMALWIGDPTLIGSLLKRVSIERYTGDSQMDFAFVIGKAFSNVPLHPIDVELLTERFAKNRDVQGIPLIVAHCAFLKSTGYSPRLVGIALHVHQVLAGDTRLLSVIPTGSLILLLQFWVAQDDDDHVVETLWLLESAISSQPKTDQASAMILLHRCVRGFPACSEAALDVLRRLIQTITLQNARLVLKSGHVEFPGEMTRSLRTSYVLRGYFAGTSLEEFLNRLDDIHEVLSSLARYGRTRQLFTPQILIGAIDDLRGGNVIAKSRFDTRRQLELLLELLEHTLGDVPGAATTMYGSNGIHHSADFVSAMGDALAEDAIFEAPEPPQSQRFAIFPTLRGLEVLRALKYTSEYLTNMQQARSFLTQIPITRKLIGEAMRSAVRSSPILFSDERLRQAGLNLVDVATALQDLAEISKIDRETWQRSERRNNSLPPELPRTGLDLLRFLASTF
jgi:hypothetical protein